MILLLRGLPGSGKSTMAGQLSPHLHAVTLNKDTIREALFPPPTTEYTTAQDDFIISLMLEAARWHLTRDPGRAVILDGRTHSRRYQVDLVRDFAATIATSVQILECVCDPETALVRIQQDKNHPAKNRNAALLEDQISKWEALPYEHCTIDTGQPLERCVEQALAYFASRGIIGP